MRVRIPVAGSISRVLTRKEPDMGDPKNLQERQKNGMTESPAERASFAYDEEAMLVKRCLDGEPEAFDRLYNRYREKVYVLSMGILMNSDDAADAVQETFALAYKNLRRFKLKSRFGTWLFRIAINSAIQLSRKLKNKRRNQPLDDAAELPAPPAVSESGVDADVVNAALVQLKPDDRAVLTMFYWEDMSLEEIAETLGCGANAAKTRLYRARERFRKEMIAEQERTR